MDFFKHVLNGAKIGATYAQKNFGSGFYHLCALSTFTLLIILVQPASLLSQLYLLLFTLITAWVFIKFSSFLTK